VADRTSGPPTDLALDGGRAGRDSLMVLRSRGGSGAEDAERGDGPSYRSSGAPERMTLASRDNQHAPRAGLGELGYGSTTAAKEVAPQIPAQSPSDRS
jgi:hypothetical protein